MKVNREYVKKQAEELIEKYALTTPVHIFQLADLIGIKWETRPTGQLEEIIKKQEPNTKEIENWQDILGYYDSKTQTIYLNTDNHPITRKRFTMAHEIGHFTMHHQINGLLRKIFFRQDIVESRDEVEAEANYFASYLLMPDREIKKKLEYTILLMDGEQTIKTFAKMFAVSPESMRIRLKLFKEEHPDLWTTYNMEQKLF
ncbi:ImmA/IrrE family metallo-endopeptidase [soil metagenome]